MEWTDQENGKTLGQQGERKYSEKDECRQDVGKGSGICRHCRERLRGQVERDRQIEID